MKPKRFTIGQKVALIERFKNPEALNGKSFRIEEVPKPSDIFTVKQYDEYCKGWDGFKWFIFLNEMPDTISYAEDKFAPVVSDSVLEQALSEIEEKISV